MLLGKKNKSQGDGEYLSENMRRSDDGAVPLNRLVKALELLEVALDDGLSNRCYLHVIFTSQETL